MTSREKERFVRTEYRELIRQQRVDGTISQAEANELSAMATEAGRIKFWTANLFGPDQSSPLLMSGSGAASLRLLTLEEIRGKEFRLLALCGTKPAGRRLKCFVGHRFTKSIERILRFNLQQLLALFGIDPVYLGSNGSAVELFREVDRLIGESDLCFFDNRATSEPSRPNVYIEAALAYARGRPFIFCNYSGESWPTDLGGMLQERYSTYGELFRTLYRRLPKFLTDNRLSLPLPGAPPA